MKNGYEKKIYLLFIIKIKEHNQENQYTISILIIIFGTPFMLNSKLALRHSNNSSNKLEAMVCLDRPK